MPAQHTCILVTTITKAWCLLVLLSNPESEGTLLCTVYGTYDIEQNSNVCYANMYISTAEMHPGD